MWKHKGGSKWKNNSRRYTNKVKGKSQVMCYECKKLGQFKFEFPILEKENEKEKKKPFFKKKKDLYLSSSKEEDEEAKLSLMANTTSKDEDNEELILNDLNHLQITYQELISNSSTLSLGYKDLKKKFSKLSIEFDSL
ncbi:hypothetical protein CR513_32704, partial [Mucuna pruriens]